MLITLIITQEYILYDNIIYYQIEEFFWYITFYLSKKYETYFKKGEKNNDVSMLKLPKNIINYN